MARYVIDLPEAAALRLTAVVDRYNANMGTSLTVLDWLSLHLKEVVLAEELSQAAARIEQEEREEMARRLEGRLIAERDRLIAGLEGGMA